MVPVALLVHYHRQPVVILSFTDTDFVSSAVELNLFGVKIERFRFKRGSIDSRCPTCKFTITAVTIAESTITERYHPSQVPSYPPMPLPWRFRLYLEFHTHKLMLELVPLFGVSGGDWEAAIRFHRCAFGEGIFMVFPC